MYRYSPSNRYNSNSNKKSLRRAIFSWLKKPTAKTRPHLITHRELSSSAAFIPRRSRSLSNYKPRTEYIKKIKLIALPVILLAWAGVLLFAPYFRITRVSYYGLNTVKKEAVEQYMNEHILSARFRWWPARNYFLINGGSIEKKLKNNFFFNAVAVKKIFPNQLIIDVTEKISSIIYDDGQQYYLLDQNGQIIKALRPVAETELKTTYIPPPLPTISTSTIETALATSTPNTASGTIKITHTPDSNSLRQEFGNFPIVYHKLSNPNDATSTIGVRVFNPMGVQGTLEWQTLVEQRGIGQVKYYVSDKNTPGLTTILNQRWNILIDPTGDLKQQADNVQLILRENNPVQYIDVRFGDRVYWK